jgi:hypothetical protein
MLVGYISRNLCSAKLCSGFVTANALAFANGCCERIFDDSDIDQTAFADINRQAVHWAKLPTRTSGPKVIAACQHK